jgi:hypothetical protein
MSVKKKIVENKWYPWEHYENKNKEFICVLTSYMTTLMSYDMN